MGMGAVSLGCDEGYEGGVGGSETAEINGQRIKLM